ncbi:uncharacterized protein LOC143301790 [Babylonia areolata]|uniref:uncharacterized protein LOC143301790 n=1 Tax=Babylonia areolata TaxID=304850 RepID=UPI003FD38E14
MAQAWGPVLTLMMMWVVAVAAVAASAQAEAQEEGPVDHTAHHTECPVQPGQEREHGMCERGPVVTSLCVEGVGSGEPIPAECPVMSGWLPEGTVCILSTQDLLALNCTSGNWTLTDSGVFLAHRQKRFFFALAAAAAAVFVGCLIFCPRGGARRRRRRRRRRSSRPSPPPNKPPRITSCPPDITKTTPAGQNEVQVTWTVPKATDPDGGNPRVNRRHGPAPGSRFPEGRTYISYEAKDSGGLTDTCSFAVHVKVTRCPFARAPLNGHRPVCSGAPEENQAGATCTFSCNKGYALQQPQNPVTCQQDGTWSHAFPTCTAVSCGDPGTVAGGSIQCANGHTYPSLCWIVCQAGYRHSGAVHTSCSEDAVWTPAPQGCEDDEAPTFPDGCPPDIKADSGPLGSSVKVTWNDSVTKDNSGEDPTLTSDKESGSSFDVGFHTVKVTATDSAGNSGSCRFFVNVQEKRCPSLTLPSGHLVCDHGFLTGSTCTASCNKGHELQGPTILTCEQSGVLGPAVPTCEVVKCPKTMPAVDRGSFVCTGGHQYLSTCTLSCPPGYRAQPPLFVTCAEDGSWSPPGTCEDVEPPSLVCPGDLETVAAPVGNPTTVTWAAPTATDNSGESVTPTSDVTPGDAFAAGLTRVTYSASDVSGNTATCHFSVSVETLSCGRPDLEGPGADRNLMQYDCPDGYVYGARCTLRCSYGYPLLGSDTIACDQPPNVSWEYDGTKPKCIENNCPVLQAPLRGAITAVLGNHGWSAFMSCKQGWDIPYKSPGYFICTNSNGKWIPERVQNCTERFIPSRAKLETKFYYSGRCDENLEELKKQFITVLKNSTYSAACDTPTCTWENVQVTCGPLSRRRRSIGDDVDDDNDNDDDEEEEEEEEEEGGSVGSQQVSKQKVNGEVRVRRSSDVEETWVTFSFDIVMDFQENNGTESDTFNRYRSMESQMRTLLKEKARSGTFDLKGGDMRPDYSYTQVTLTFDGCPGGTQYSYNEYSKKVSCVGCAQGLYLEDDDCKECPVGHYTQGYKPTSCTACPPGFSTLTTASHSVDDCKKLCTPGHFSPTGFAPCLPCPAGQFQSRDRGLTCDLCPVGTWTVYSGVQSRNECVVADVLLAPNVSLRTSMTLGEPSLTLVTWLKLSRNTSLSLELRNADDGPGESASTSLRVCSVDGGSLHVKDPDSASAAQCLGISADQWTRLVITMQTGNGSCSIYRDGQLLTVIPHAFRPTTVITTCLQGKALLSGMRAEARVWSQEEIQAPRSSCVEDPLADSSSNNNVLSWSPRPSTIVIPVAVTLWTSASVRPADLGGSVRTGLGASSATVSLAGLGPPVRCPQMPATSTSACTVAAACRAGRMGIAASVRETNPVPAVNWRKFTEVGGSGESGPLARPHVRDNNSNNNSSSNNSNTVRGSATTLCQPTAADSVPELPRRNDRVRRACVQWTVAGARGASGPAAALPAAEGRELAGVSATAQPPNMAAPRAAAQPMRRSPALPTHVPWTGGGDHGPHGVLAQSRVVTAACAHVSGHVRSLSLPMGAGRARGPSTRQGSATLACVQNAASWLSGRAPASTAARWHAHTGRPAGRSALGAGG